jgi:hypothetical protein
MSGRRGLSRLSGELSLGQVTSDWKPHQVILGSRDRRGFPHFR